MTPQLAELWAHAKKAGVANAADGGLTPFRVLSNPTFVLNPGCCHAEHSARNILFMQL